MSQVDGLLQILAIADRGLERAEPLAEHDVALINVSRRSSWPFRPSDLGPGYPVSHSARWFQKMIFRLRSDRVLRRTTPTPERHPRVGRPPRYGDEFVLGDPATWGNEKAVTVTDTRRYGTATARAWDRLHPQLTWRAAWRDHQGPLPIIEGTLIRLTVDHLPSGG